MSFAKGLLATWQVVLATASVLSVGRAYIAYESAETIRDGEYHAVLNGVNDWYRIAGAANHTTPMVIVHGGPGGSTYKFEHTIGPRTDEVWDKASRTEIDHVLFQSMSVAAEMHRLDAESGERNTGKMFRVLLARPYRRPALVDDLRKLTVPALVMVGAHDRNVGVDMNHEIADALPHAQYVVFANSAHFPDLEEPEKYASTVMEFLGSK